MNLLVVDTETTGHDSQENGIAQLSSVVVTREDIKSDWVEIADSVFNRFVDPPSDCVFTEEAFAVNGIDPDWLRKNGENEIEVVNDFVQYASKYRNERLFPVICGWNIHFDLGFMEAAFKRSKTPWPFTMISLDVGARWRWDNIQLFDHHIFKGIEGAADALLGRGVKHDALDDVRLTIDLMNALNSQETIV